MALSNAGKLLITSAVSGGSFISYNNANANLGVGDSTTAFAPTHTDLQGSNKQRRAVDATFPTVSGSTITYQATFGTSDANFAWQEWALFNAPTAGIMFNRKVESLGTKPNTQTWVITVTITVNNP